MRGPGTLMNFIQKSTCKVKTTFLCTDYCWSQKCLSIWKSPSCTRKKNFRILYTKWSIFRSCNC